eukprot:6183212-Pleurochrysis_carterae.AAC.3
MDYYPRGNNECTEKAWTGQSDRAPHVESCRARAAEPGIQNYLKRRPSSHKVDQQRAPDHVAPPAPEDKKAEVVGAFFFQLFNANASAAAREPNITRRLTRRAGAKPGSPKTRAQRCT